MKRDPKSLLWDAHGAAGVIAAITSDKTFADFDQDIVLRSAVERQFEIVGEAFAQLARGDAAMAARIPDLREIIAFRNVLIHGYASYRPCPRLAGDRGKLAAASRNAGRASRRARVRPSRIIDYRRFHDTVPVKAAP